MDEKSKPRKKYVTPSLPYWEIGSIGWNASGVIKMRPCSTDRKDFMNLGYAELPKTHTEWVRARVIAGLMMSYPAKDIAWWVKTYSRATSGDIDSLVEEITTIARLLEDET